MDNRHMLFVLHHMEGIGWKTISTLVNQFPNLDQMKMFTKDDWLHSGIPASRVDLLVKGFQKMNSGTVEALLEEYDYKQIKWVTMWDEAYPELLREIPQPPWILYYQGNLELTKRVCIGMVGTRNPTAYGRLSAERLSLSLSEAGVCIVSGLARGIDKAAHDGALQGPGSTIAVLGCSMDQVYPPENKTLCRKIASEGLVLSESPLGTVMHPGLFPQRNRIIAGLSLGVVVVEAASKSGALITADQALDASRDVFAVPGPIYSPKSQGTLGLIKQGAKLVTGPEDVLEEYAARISLEQKAYIKNTIENVQVLSADELKILDLLASEKRTVDELLVQSQFTFGHLHSVLINLLMMRRIVELPGSVYTVP